MDCEFIKRIVEKSSGIEDIGLKTRTNNFAFYRFVYFKLCRKFAPKKSLTEIANVVGLTNHATVLHGIHKLDELKNSKFLKIYENCYNGLVVGMTEDMKQYENEKIDDETRQMIHQHHRIKHIVLTEKYNTVIQKLQSRISHLKKQIR